MQPNDPVENIWEALWLGIQLKIACRSLERRVKLAENVCRSIERHPFSAVFACRSIERHAYSITVARRSRELHAFRRAEKPAGNA